MTIPTGRKRGRPEKIKSIEFTKAQKIISYCDKRFVFVCAGRRFGKTLYSENVLKTKALENPDQIIWYCAPTYKTAKDLMWLPLVNLPKAVLKDYSKTECYVEFHNGSRVYLKGSDREDNLRGRGIDYCVMEEYSFHKKGVWDLIIRPQLADRKGGALFIGTPSMKKGPHYRQLHDYAKKAFEGNGDPEWGYFHFTIYDNPFIDPQEIAGIKASTSDVAWKQEYLGEFVEEEGVVYHEFNPIRNVYSSGTSFTEARKSVCATGLDWGLSDDTAAVWAHVMADGHIVVTDEHSQNNWTVDQQAAAIKKINEINPSIKATPLDETTFRRESDGMSIAAKFNRAGIRVIPISAQNPEHGIDIIKRFLAGDGIDTWLHISDKCRKLIKAMSEWQHGEHEPDIVCALRFAVTFIQKTRMSKLCSDMNIPASTINPPAMGLLPERKPVTMNKSTEFTWDYQSGGWI